MEAGMVALSQRNVERVFWHLGYGGRQNIDAADIARVNQAVQEIPSDYLKTRIIEMLDLCDRAWDNLNLSTNDGYSTKDIIGGDLNRTTIRTDAADQQKIWYREYIRLTDLLARELAVANYQHDDMNRYRHDKYNVGAYINVIPGVADTSVASRAVQKKLLGSAFGYDFGYLHG
jgi:hypothetical protein